METAKRTIILLLLALLATSAAQSAENQKAAGSDTLTASCLMKITCDSAILPLNLETIEYLLHSSGVGGKAAIDILSISSNQAHEFFTVEYVEGDTGGLGGYGLPPSSSRAEKSSGLEYDMYREIYGDMPGYDYMMMEKESPSADQAPLSDSLKPYSSSSVVRSISRTQPGTGRSSSTKGTTVSRSLSTTGTRYGRSSSGRSGGSYGYSTASRAPRQTIKETAADSTDEQTEFFSLSVNLPEDVIPLAKEYMNALVDNLRQALMNAYNDYEDKLENMLQFAESRRDRARSQLEKAMKQTKVTGSAPVIELDPIDVVVYEQLEMIVDLPNLTPSTSFVDVIEQLKTAVGSPLQIQPNWKDLLENGEVEQTTPAGMDPLTGIRLRKALEILLDGVSGDIAELKYVVDEGVILIGTADYIPRKLIPLVYEIPALAHSAGGAKDLIDTIQNTIDPESWYEMSEIGEATITPYPSHQPRKLAILQTYENHQKIQKFLESIKVDIPVGTPQRVPEEILLSEKNNLLREKQDLEMELARLESRMPAVEAQIRRIQMEIDDKVNADQVSLELKDILAIQVKYLEGVKRLVENGRVSNSELADAEEKLARAKIELAMRREQIGSSAGTDQLVKFSNELATLAIDIAEKKAMLEIVSNQLNRTEQQLTVSAILDPQVSQIRHAVRALEIAERRINELNTLALNVQPPTVSMLGSE